MAQRKRVVRHLPTSEDSDECDNEITDVGDKCGYESADLFDSPSSVVLASDSDLEDLPFTKRATSEAISVSKTYMPNSHKQDQLLSLRSKLRRAESGSGHASTVVSRRIETASMREPGRPTKDSSVDACITRTEADELKKLLRTVVKRLDKTELRLQSIEAKLETSSFSSPDSVSSRGKKPVPRVVRVSIHFTSCKTSVLVPRNTRSFLLYINHA